MDVGDVGLRLPTLDEVFLSLTGHHADEQAATGDRDADDGMEPIRPRTAGDAAEADDLEVTR